MVKTFVHYTMENKVKQRTKNLYLCMYLLYLLHVYMQFLQPAFGSVSHSQPPIIKIRKFTDLTCKFSNLVHLVLDSFIRFVQMSNRVMQCVSIVQIWGTCTRG